MITGHMLYFIFKIIFESSLPGQKSYLVIFPVSGLIMVKLSFEIKSFRVKAILLPINMPIAEKKLTVLSVSVLSSTVFFSQFLCEGTSIDYLVRPLY